MMGNQLRVLDMFAGLGGFSLGLERTGDFKTVGFIEIEPLCQRVLARHWPDIPCHSEVITYEFREGEADVITAGFPCQDISYAGAGARLSGSRSGLYRHVIRALRVVRPRFAILENVAALLGRGLDTVLGDMAEIGVDAEWHCIPAGALGAPHIRDRLFIVAHPGASEGRPLSFACRRVAWKDTLLERPEGPGQPQGALTAQWGDDPILVADALGRMDAGVPVQLGGFNAVANAVTTVIPELIGRAILSADPALCLAMREIA